MRQLYKDYLLGKLRLLYYLDEEQHMGMLLIPEEKTTALADKKCRIEPLVQAHICGDGVGPGYTNGHSMTDSETTSRFRFVSQKESDNKIVTLLEDGLGRSIEHIVCYDPDWEAVTVNSRFINGSDQTVRLEMLSSVNLGGLTPFEEGMGVGCLKRHCIRSAWSAEGRVVSESIEDMNMEPSWGEYGLRYDRIGQVGSMPVRDYYPFTAVEDTKNAVTWAVALSCNGSWQMELRRVDNGLSLTAGLADFNYGHWAKDLAPDESFTGPQAFVTAVTGGMDEASQSLLTVQKTKNTLQCGELPVLFNEYCTTWGVPSESNLMKILDVLEGKGIDCLVIDCGWYTDGVHPWSKTNGDWEVGEDVLFPHGLQRVVDEIHKRGMKAGIWFEPETCGPLAKISSNEDWLLKRNGHVIRVDGKCFMDMRRADVRTYLDERVIAFLKKYQFDYIKVDYNESIGVGCDGAESLGEGLRQNMEYSRAFFQKMQREIPGLIIENCSSGGHRTEPSMMEVTAMASFSDAHECAEIPIIAANMHRMILPGQSQIWAVLRKEDSSERITYSLAAGFLGVLCLSGDVFDLNPAQWAQVEKGIEFYRSCAHLIRDGRSQFFGPKIQSYRQPQGWQAVMRTVEHTGQALVVAHHFAGQMPETVKIPMAGAKALGKVFCGPGTQVELTEDGIAITFSKEFTAAAVLIER